MPLTIPRKTIDEFSRCENETELKQCITIKLNGCLRSLDIMFNRVLVAIYCRPGKSKGGLLMPDSVKEEDLWQSKVGLVLAMGPDAFEDDAVTHFNGQRVNIGEWAVFKVGDSWEMLINDVPCRLVEDAYIKMRTRDPSLVY